MMVVGLEVSLLLIRMTQYCCTNSYPAIFYPIQFLVVGLNLESENLPDKLVNLWIFTIGLTSSGCQPHTSSVWPWSGALKVHLYNTFLGGLRQRMKNMMMITIGKRVMMTMCTEMPIKEGDSLLWAVFLEEIIAGKYFNVRIVSMQKLIYSNYSVSS